MVFKPKKGARSSGTQTESHPIGANWAKTKLYLVEKVYIKGRIFSDARQTSANFLQLFL